MNAHVCHANSMQVNVLPFIKNVNRPWRMNANDCGYPLVYLPLQHDVDSRLGMKCLNNWIAMKFGVDVHIHPAAL